MNNDITKEIEFHKKVIEYYESLYRQGKIVKGTLDVQIKESKDFLKKYESNS